MEFSDGLAVAAIALSLSTIFFGVLFYHWQTEQGARIAQTISDFAKEMHAVLGEIKGLTTSTREQQERQTETLINALADRQRTEAAVAAEDVAGEGVRDILQRLQGLEETLPTAADGTRPELEEIRERLDSLAKQVGGAVQQATAANLGLFREMLDRALRAEGSGEHGPLGNGGGISLVFYPREIAQGGDVRIAPSGWVSSGDFEDLRCLVSSPHGLTWEGEVHQDLKWGSPPSIGFPSGFPGASTDTPGQYLVTVLRRGRAGWESAAGGAFYVSPPTVQRHD
jgi:hypothetical protein